MHGTSSDSFLIQQGVRQGGVLSPHLYKAYINRLLIQLQDNHNGYCIGHVYVGSLTSADDPTLLSFNERDL